MDLLKTLPLPRSREEKKADRYERRYRSGNLKNLSGTSKKNWRVIEDPSEEDLRLNSIARISVKELKDFLTKKSVELSQGEAELDIFFDVAKTLNIAVRTACKYFKGDSENYRILSPEYSFSFPHSEDERIIYKGKIDMPLITISLLEGKIIDYKRVSNLDREVLNKYSRSFQPDLYSIALSKAFPQLKRIIYELRIWDEKSQQLVNHEKEVDLVTARERISVLTQNIFNAVTQSAFQRTHLHCYAWNAECKWYNSCWEMSEDHFPSDWKIYISQSLGDLFLSCPQKYFYYLKEMNTRDVSHYEIEKSNPWALRGTLYHEAMDWIYSRYLTGSEIVFTG